MTDIKQLHSFEEYSFSIKEVIKKASFTGRTDWGKTLTDIIYEKLIPQPYFPVLLNPKKIQKPGAVDIKWKVDVKSKLESDL